MVRKYLQDTRALVARLCALVMIHLATFDAVARKRLSRALFDLAVRIRALPPMAGGAPDDDDDDDADADADADKDTDKDADADKDKDADVDKDADKDVAKGNADIDWKAQARKHEREAKKARKERDTLASEKAERDKANQTEQERAVAEAREAGKAEALTEAQKERRADRLENSVIRLAAKGVKVGDGDEVKTVKFDDPEDALTFIERALAKGDIDPDDIYDDDGKVKTDAVEQELVALLGRKPRLAAGDSDSGAEKGKGRGARGDGDGGKGKGGGKSLDELSPEEHLKQIQNK